VFARKFVVGLGFVATAPIAMLIIVLRPLIQIKFVRVGASRIGELALVELYLSWKSVGLREARSWDLVYLVPPISNTQLAVMIKRHTTVAPFPSAIHTIYRCIRIFNQSQFHTTRIMGDGNSFSVITRRSTQLMFSPAELRRGMQLLKEIGLPPEARWVCIHNRDQEYLSRTLPESDHAFGGSWSYHKYRNFPVGDLRLASEELVKRGYYVLRMGSMVAEPFRADNPMIVDYSSHRLRSDFADIYLLANCELYLGSDSGIFSVPAVFRKPFAFVNSANFEIHATTYNWNPTPFLIKRAYHRSKQRFLCLQEMYMAGLNEIDGVKFDNLCKINNVEMVNNTPDEIRDVLTEIIDRINGNWHPDPVDEKLQSCFWGTIRRYGHSSNKTDGQARIGASFLRTHQYLLG